MVSNTLLMYYHYRVVPRIERLDSLFGDDRIVFVTDAHPFSPLRDPCVDHELEGKDVVLLNHEVSASLAPWSNRRACRNIADAGVPGGMEVDGEPGFI